MGKITDALLNKAKKASKHYCPNSSNNRHQMTRHKNTDLPKGEHDEKVHGVTHTTYCGKCGWTDHKK